MFCEELHLAREEFLSQIENLNIAIDAKGLFVISRKNVSGVSGLRNFLRENDELSMRFLISW